MSALPLEQLLQDANDGLDALLRRMRSRLRDDGSYELEREAFGLEDPRTIEAEREEEARRPEEQSKRFGWWVDECRRNWPD